MPIVTPVLLAGGSGSRLWPLSRKSYPKQYSRIFSDESLFQKSAKRLTSSNPLRFSPCLTITNEEFRFMVKGQFQAIRINPGVIISEPKMKNRAPAVWKYKQENIWARTI